MCWMKQKANKQHCDIWMPATLSSSVSEEKRKWKMSFSLCVVSCISTKPWKLNKLFKIGKRIAKKYMSFVTGVQFYSHVVHSLDQVLICIAIVKLETKHHLNRQKREKEEINNNNNISNYALRQIVCTYHIKI